MVKAKEVEPVRDNCWISREIMRLVRAIAARDRMTISEVLERELSTPIRRRYQRGLDREAAQGGES